MCYFTSMWTLTQLANMLVYPHLPYSRRAIIFIFFWLLGEQSETLTNEFQLRFWYLVRVIAR